MYKLTLLAFLLLFFLSVKADEKEDFCTRRATTAVSEIHQLEYPDMSEREIDIAKKTAVIACHDTYSTRFPLVTSKQAKVSDNKPIDNNNDKSWLEKLLDKETKEDVSPMMKNHRTGGK